MSDTGYILNGMLARGCAGPSPGSPRASAPARRARLARNVKLTEGKTQKLSALDIKHRESLWLAACWHAGSEQRCGMAAPPSSERASERSENTVREEVAREEEDEDEHAHEVGVVQEGLAVHDPAVGEGGGRREARHLDQPAGLSDAVALRAPAQIALRAAPRCGPSAWKCRPLIGIVSQNAGLFRAMRASPAGTTCTPV